MSPQTPPEVFISYSSKDKRYKDELLKQLKVLAQQDVISTWHDGLLIPGQQWNEEIIEHLNSSRVILLLISPDFLTSDYVNNVELTVAAERHKRKEACVIPVLVRNVNAWKSQPFGQLKLGDLQAVPTAGKFITEWTNRNKAYADVARGIQEAVETLNENTSYTIVSPPIPRSPIVGFVNRLDSEGYNIVERLKNELAPQKRQVVALWGAGGVGKTTLAAEAARLLANDFSQRVVWVSADGRTDLPFITFLDEVATQLVNGELRKLAPERKSEAVRALITSAPTLVVLDNFETISADERQQCLEFLTERVQCSALITTRQRLEHARSVPITGMTPAEAEDFVNLLIAQTQDPQIFAVPYRKRLIETAEANPLIMEWIVGQIDLANDPEEVLNELTHGEGDAAQRVFDRSYNLPQLNDGGRAVLLALSLFTPSGARPTVAAAAGMDLRKNKDKKRFKNAQEALASLWLIKKMVGGQRLAVAGLTRELTSAHLANDLRAKTLPPRFVSHFLRYAEAHALPTPEDYNALESEKDNLLGASALAYANQDWQTVMRLAYALALPGDGVLDVRGYWDDALRIGELALKIARASRAETEIAAWSHNVAVMYESRGESSQARSLHDESLRIDRRLDNKSGIATSLNVLATLARENGELEEAGRLQRERLEIDKKLGNQRGIIRGLHGLAAIARDQGDFEEARRLVGEGLEIGKKINSQADLAWLLYTLATLAHDQGEVGEAQRLVEEGLGIDKRIGNQSGIASSVFALGLLAYNKGEFSEARRLFTESLQIDKKLGNQSGIARSLRALANSAYDLGGFDDAQRLYLESLGIERKLGDQSGISSSLQGLGEIALERGEFGEARELYDESLAARKKLNDQQGIAISLHELGRLHFAQEENDEADRCLQASWEILKKLGARANQAECLESIGRLRVAQGHLVEALPLFDQALDIAEKLGIPFRIASVKHSLGQLAKKQGERERAVPLLREALAIFEKLGSRKAKEAKRDLERVEGELSA